MNEPVPSQALSFDLESLGQPQQWTVHHRGLGYTGEVIIAESFDHQWGELLPPHLNFRLVFFTVPRRIPPRRILDTRIAMVVPGRSPAEAHQSLRQELKSSRRLESVTYTSGIPIQLPCEMPCLSERSHYGASWRALWHGLFTGKNLYTSRNRAAGSGCFLEQRARVLGQ